MKFTALKYYFLFVLALIIALIGLGQLYLNQKSKAVRMQTNLEHLNADLDFYKTENGKIAAKNQVLHLRTNELEKVFPELHLEITNLKVKLKRAESVSQSIVHNTLSISVPLKDSVAGDSSQLKVFEYEDQHHKVIGIARADTQHLSIQTTDTLTQVVFRGKRRKPLLWIFSKRQLEQVISSSNPSTTIIYSKHIQITKNR